MKIPDYSKYSDQELIDCINLIDKNLNLNYNDIWLEIKKRNIEYSLMVNNSNIPIQYNEKILSKRYILYNSAALIFLINISLISNYLSVSDTYLFPSIALYYLGSILVIIVYTNYCIYNSFKNRFKYPFLFTFMKIGYYPLIKINFTKYIKDLKPVETEYIKRTLEKQLARVFIQFVLTVFVTFFIW